MMLPFTFFFAMITGEIDVTISDVLYSLQSNEKSTSVQIILKELRLPEVLTALTAGAMLSVSGLIMQSVFRNPLAGPSVLGVSSGASLGVVFLIVLFPTLIQDNYFSKISLVLFAALGAIGVIFLLSTIQWRLRNIELLLIAGLLISYFLSSSESMLLANTSAQNIKTFVHWGFGSFSKTNLNDVLFLSICLIVLITLTFLCSKKLDAFHYNDETLLNTGISKNKASMQLFVISGLLCATVTAFCGPIAFIGLCVPHICRMMIKTNRHFYLIILCLIIGSHIAMFCAGLSRLSFKGNVIPVNSITSFLGAPFVIYLLLKGYKRNHA